MWSSKMNKLTQFCKQFSDMEILDVIQIGRRYYQAPKNLLAIKDQVTSRDVYSIGVPLGEEKKGFEPSPALLEMLAKNSMKKAYINKRGSWLFLCKRDVFEESIVSTTVKEGLVLVQNEHDENLGYGELKHIRGKAFIKLLLDRGDYLRREN